MTDRTPTRGGNVVEAAESFVAVADGRSMRAANEMATFYAQSVGLLDDELRRLEGAIAARAATGGPIPVSWLHSQGRYRSLLDQAATTFRGYAMRASRELDYEMAQMVALANDAVQAELGAAYKAGRGIVGNFNRLPDPAIKRLAGTLSAASPLRSLLDEMPRNAANALDRGLKEGIVLGLSPREVVQRGRGTLLDDKWRSARLIRTEMFRAFREGNRAGFRANDHLIDAWIWHSAAGTRTCAACWAMHGQEFPLDEPMGSHPNCRCTQVPKTKSWAELGFPGIPESRPSIPTGREMFRKLAAADQRRILGPGKYLDYRDGLIDLPDLVRRHDDRDWGTSRTVGSRQFALDNGADRIRRELMAQNLRDRAARGRAAREALPWDEQVRALLPRDGADRARLTEPAVREIGSILRREIKRRQAEIPSRERRIADFDTEVARLDALLENKQEELNALTRRLTAEGMGLADRLNHREYKRLDRQYDKLSKQKWQAVKDAGRLKYSYDELDNTLQRQAVLDVLSEIRPFGSESKFNYMQGSSPSIKKLLDQQAKYFPADWWDQSTQSVPMFVQVPGKGSVRYGRSARGAYHGWRETYSELITYTGDQSTAVHELAHRMQRTVTHGMIRDLERDFYDRRTADSPISHMGPGYDAHESTRRDEFIHPYIGRYVAGREETRAAETLSMGMQGLFADRSRADIPVYEDDDMLDFILGVLASV